MHIMQCLFNHIRKAKQTLGKQLMHQVWKMSVLSTSQAHTLILSTVTAYNNNNNDRLTAFDPGQPG